METRSIQQTSRIQELERATQEKDALLQAQATELAELRAAAAATAAAAAAPAAAPAIPDGNLPLPPAAGLATQQVSVTTALRPPPIERFSGDREESADFALAIDRRLQATGQMHSLTGLEFAVGHFQGYASTWWRYYALEHPEVNSWLALRGAFCKEFELVDGQKLYEQRLMELSQTGAVQSYLDEFLATSARLPDLSDGFKQRRLIRGSCSYLREKCADKEFTSLLDLARYIMRLLATIDERHFRPDAEVLAPVLAALPARPTGSRKDITCFRCGRPGHSKSNCKVKLTPADKANAEKAYAAYRANKGRATKGSARFGKYDGSGRVNAIEADSVDADKLSDDELRQGNGLA